MENTTYIHTNFLPLYVCIICDGLCIYVYIFLATFAMRNLPVKPSY